MGIVVPTRSLSPGGRGAFEAPPTSPVSDATGGQLQQAGQAVSTAGAAVAKLASDYNAELDQAEATQALNRYDSQAIEAVAEYKNLSGAAANPDSQGQALKKLGDLQSRILTGLRNDDQRTVVGDRFNRRTLEITGQMTSHTLGEVKSFRFGESSQLRASSASQFANAIVSGRPEDGPVARTHRNTALDQVDIMAEIMGWGPEEKKAELLDTLTAMHGSVIQQLVDADRADDALEYLEGVPDGEIDPQEKGKLTSLVRQASLNDRATRLTFDVIEEVEKSSRTITVGSETPGPSDLDPQDLLDRGLAVVDFWWQEKRITSAERDAVRSRLKEEAGTRSQRQSAQAVETMLEAEQWLQLPENILKNPNQMPPSIYNELFRIGRLDDIVTWHKNGRQKVSDPVFVANILDMTPEELRTTTISEGQMLLETAHLPPNEQNLAMARYRSAFGKATEEDDSVINQANRIMLAAVGEDIVPRGKGPSSWGDLEATRFKRFNQAIQDGINEAIRAGDPYQGSGLQTIIDNILLDRVFMGGSAVMSGFLGREEELPISLLTPIGDPRLFTEQQKEDLEALRRTEVRIAVPGLAQPVTVKPTEDIRSDVYNLLERQLREGDPTTTPPTPPVFPSVYRVAEDWLRRGRPKDLPEAVNNPKAKSVEDFLAAIRKRGR